MTSLDDKLQALEDKCVKFFVIYEPYITEYLIIPLLFEATFQSSEQRILHTIMISIFIYNKLISSSVSSRALFLVPACSYAASQNRYLSALLYASVYSQHMYESIAIGLSSLVLSHFYSFNIAYLCHVLYIVCRNNLQVKITPFEKSNALYIVFNAKSHKTLKQRYINKVNNIHAFINDVAVDNNTY